MACTVKQCKNQKEMYVIIDNIRSSHNVGSIFRTCDAVGVAKIFLTGCTPTPVDRFGRARTDIAKTALGAEKTVPWKYYTTTEDCLAALRSEHKRAVCVAVEQSKQAVDYREYTLPDKPSAFIFGNEVGGIDEETLALCDTIIELPMVGEKESLNVAVTAGVVLYHSVFAQHRE